VYLRGNPFSFTFTLHVLFCRHHFFFFLARTLSLLAIVAHLHLKLFPLWMRVKRLMTKNTTIRGTVVSWSTSTINKSNLNKAKKVGFLSYSMEYVLPGDEVIPHPADGFQVMFFFPLPRPFSRPMNLFVGLCIFMACSFISSRQIILSTLRVSSCFVKLS
jgi:hypothetical protein